MENIQSNYILFEKFFFKCLETMSHLYLGICPNHCIWFICRTFCDCLSVFTYDKCRCICVDTAVYVYMALLIYNVHFKASQA